MTDLSSRIPMTAPRPRRKSLPMSWVAALAVLAAALLASTLDVPAPATSQVLDPVDGADPRLIEDWHGNSASFRIAD
ncbi:MAG: hypothetical protein AAF501_07420 [Pseudomonadota bacterium]